MGLTLLLGLVVVGTGPLASVASAAPIDDKRAEAAAIQNQIDANGAQISALSEAYDGAQLRLEQAQAAIADAEAKIEAAQQKIKEINVLVKQRAASVYKRAASGRSLDGLDLKDTHELNSRRAYANAQAERDNGLLAQLDKARAQLAEQRAAAEQARTDAETERANIAASKSQVEAANAEQQQLLAKVQGELQQLVREEQARREAEAAARARARFNPGGTALARGDGNAGALPNVPPPSPAAGAAIEFARAQLGKPYVYAASGPDAYDCSGLTMAAWGAAGVRLPHYSGAQYDRLPKVPLDQMQPGDLVFWGPGGSDHVGLYVGDGMMIHAGHTGAVVKVAAVYGSPIGAARPG